MRPSHRDPWGPRRRVLAAGQKAETERAPDAAGTVDGERADGVVDAQPLHQVDGVDADDACDGADDDRSSGRDPVAGASDGNEACQEAVDGDAGVPDLVTGIHPGQSAQSPCASGEGGVGRDAAAQPAASIAESVLPGLKPYQPNQRMTPPTAAMVMS